jgi:2-hydroxychromene-2-carboxylate isomerase|tara:strand:- start:2229 stop:2831 length:603 start_codon:yes stop_codon:yes gene_type:complete
MKVEYYYSIASPFSYLALERFLSLVKKYNLEIEEKPLDLVGKIFSNTGGLPVPKRHPSRQKYRLIEIDRIAKKFNVKINKQPKFFPPSDPHLPAKFVIAACKKGDKLRFGKTCLEYIWSLEKDISDYKILEEICEKLKLNFEEIKNLALSDEIDLKYKKNSKDAIDQNVFGAPSYVFENEIFWGQDRLEYLEDAIKKTTN